MSYYTKELDFIQRVGRILRFRDGHKPVLIIYRTMDTQETKWFDDMMQGDNREIIYFPNVEKCIENLKQFYVRD